MRRILMRLAVCAMIVACMTAYASPAVAQAANPANELSGFHMVLLVASNKPGPPPEGLTPAMIKALKDVEALLPFKSYRILDTALLRGPNGGTTRVATQYLATLTVWRNEDNGSLVKLSMRDYYAIMNAKTDGTVPNVLESTFRIGRGETVVAGTSRVFSEDSLVVLLTALTDKK